MAIRMIVSDLDGTLLDSAYHLSAANRTALREAAAQGVRVLVATGRICQRMGAGYARHQL